MTPADGSPQPPPAALAGLHAEVAGLREQVSQLRDRVESADTAPERAGQIANWTAARTQIRATLLGIHPPDLFSGLDPHVPLALLPVRLETRFGDPGTDVLRVRIFPDDLHVDGHDAQLTETEAQLGAALWTAPADILASGEPPPAETPAPNSPDGRRARWTALVRVLGGPRAAWVAHATRPVQTASGGPAPTPSTKSQAYVRPAVARGLPDRWLVRAYLADRVVGEAWTSPVGVDLHMAPDPQAVPGPQDAGADLPVVDPELRWLLDYAAAVSAGMAVDVPLPAGTDSLDRVVAVGVRASTSTADAATELASLLTAHRYTDRLGFLPAGSPTSNNPDARSAEDRHVDPDALWQQEFGAPAGAGTAASILATALGLPAGILDGSPGSDDGGDRRAEAMQTALWAATWGYYLGELLDASALGTVEIDQIRAHYLRFVRGRGTLPTLRVGRQPYGVLPLLPLARWSADGASHVVDSLARLLTRVRPLWQYGVGRPVTTSEGPNFDAAFTKVMSTDATARSYAIRSAIADRTFDPSIFTGVDTQPGNSIIDALIGSLLGLGSNPLILDVFSPTAQPVRAPLVVDPSDPTPDATVQGAIRGLRASNPMLVLTVLAWLKPTPDGPATLLHTLLRRSLLIEYAAAGMSLTGEFLHPTPLLAMAAAAPAPPAPASPPMASGLLAAQARIPTSMLFGLSPNPAGGFTPVLSLPSAIATPAVIVTGGMAAGEWLWRNAAEHAQLRRNLDDTLAALDLLGTLSAAEVELLLKETLDLATHRWTAWAESVAADKLARLRTTAPTGVALGGWGVVERVTRRPRKAVDSGLALGASAGPLWEDTRPGGFVHAPSTAQAATAAVLRAAHLAHGGENDPTCAIDLSSAPARVAVRVAAGIRAGQELGALLGYELERDLHERSADVLIARLRAYAPRWLAGGTFVEGDPEEIVSPSAVVDGLALANANPAAVAKTVLPGAGAASPNLAAALAGALGRLREHQHALADLLTAETVHQTLSGNTARAGAVLDAAHRGGLPPQEFDVLRTPRGGTTLTCRVGVLLPAGDGALPGGWPQSPRGNADPACATWLAGVLPPLSRVRMRIADAGGAVTDAELPAGASLGPLDLVLDRPEIVRARIQLALAPHAQIVPGRDPAWTPDTLGLEELLTVAGELREALAARPLRRTDLLTAGASAGASDERDVADLANRLAAARAALQTAADRVAAASGLLQTAVGGLAAGGSTPASSGLDPVLAGARAALGAALALGLMLQLPDAATPNDHLGALGAASAELGRRLALPASAPDASADDLSAALKGLLGAGQPALPRLLVDAEAAAAAGPGLATGDGFLATDAELACDWLQNVAGVRAATGHLAAALHGCEALSAGVGLPGGWRIVEASGHSDAWTATLGAAELAGRGPVATAVLWAEGNVNLAAGSHISGLLVDEWVEVVPQPVASTSIAYQAEAPSARAPQAILLGVAPDVAAGWDVDTVVDLVREAVDLAALRTVDAETGAWFGRMLPAVLLPDGDSSDVIAAPALSLIQIDPSLLEIMHAKAKKLG
jgi:hypothetical protein